MALALCSQNLCKLIFLYLCVIKFCLCHCTGWVLSSKLGFQSALICWLTCVIRIGMVVSGVKSTRCMSILLPHPRPGTKVLKFHRVKLTWLTNNVNFRDVLDIMWLVTEPHFDLVCNVRIAHIIRTHTFSLVTEPVVRLMIAETCH